MRARITATLIALAMMLPTAALAAGLDCEQKRVILDRCCGDQGDQEDTSTDKILAACCCSITGTSGLHVDDQPMLPPASHDDVVVATPAIAAVAPLPAPGHHARVPTRARAPPPQTLFAQHVALLC